jgi:hypothetical protein
MEALPVLMNIIAPTYVAITLSVTLVLIFGEVIPQVQSLLFYLRSLALLGNFFTAPQSCDLASCCVVRAPFDGLILCSCLATGSTSGLFVWK